MVLENTGGFGPALLTGYTLFTESVRYELVEGLLHMVRQAHHERLIILLTFYSVLVVTIITCVRHQLPYRHQFPCRHRGPYGRPLPAVRQAG